MNRLPPDEKPEPFLSPADANEGSSGPPRRKRSRRRKSSRPQSSEGHITEPSDDFDDDDEDDLTLPTYGMRLDKLTKIEDATERPAKTAKPQTLKPEVHPRRPAEPPAERRVARIRTDAQRPPRARSQREDRPQEEDRPQAQKPTTQRVPPEKLPAAGPPRERPIREKSAEDRPPRERTARERPAREEPVRAEQPREERPRDAQPRERRTRERPTRERSPRDASREANRDTASPQRAPRESTASERPSREPVATERPRAAKSADKSAHSPKFAALGVSDFMLDALAAAGYEEPTPVQEGFIPRALTGADVMGQAQTGTGKTAAFAIPILEMLQPHRRGAPPQALAMVPTRELAVQVRDEIEKLSLGRNVSIVAVYGGKPIRQQVELLNRGAAMIVGTPGRVLDLMSRGALSFNELRVVVLDEADRMLDIGFRPDIEKILKRCPASRQTLLLSATLAPPVKRLAERYMREPEVLDFSPTNVSVETIEQFYFTVDPEKKFDLLVKLLERENPKQVIIFCRTKRGTEKIHMRLSRRFQDVDTIHGDLQQSARDRVMKAFREGRVHWLVATDVVGRGIDVSGISHIINYDIPAFCDDYVHRVGRTGRMGREGVAYTFVSPEEGGELTRIEIRINRLLKRDEIPGFQAFGDPRPADGVPLGDGSGGMDDDLVESKPATKPVFGKNVKRVRRAL